MNTVAIFIIIAALIILVIILVRKIPLLRVIDVDSITKERERKVKEQLILSKLQRTGGAKLGVVAKTSIEAVRTVSGHGRRAVQKLYRMEQYYQKLRRGSKEGAHAYGGERIKDRIDEATSLIKQEEYIPAEKIFIDIISHNPKCVDAYEELGNMYIKAGQHEQAKETLKFALRLAPDDASVNVSLAELELGLGNKHAALPYLREAITKRSKNPKYLDFYIETALQVGALKDIRNGIKLLKEVNPENRKIEEFEKKFLEMKETYIRKTESTEQLQEEVELGEETDTD